MDVECFLEELLSREEVRDCIARHEILPAQPPDFSHWETGELGVLAPIIDRAGWKQLYCHQAESLRLAREGNHVVIATGTASGKTLCYNLAILESLIREPQARALYLYPTKALAQDQLRHLRTLLEYLPQGVETPMAETYDGDTPTHRRRRIRSESRLILSNPDMLHQSILPAHPRWASFFRSLRFVVLDEIHVYRGVFGSHVANVLRRLDRICRHYGSQPQFLCASATIRNPQEIAEKLTGQPFSLIQNSGAARGRRHFLFWNPPPTRFNPAIRRSALSEARRLLSQLLRKEIQTLAFLRTRAQAEMLFRQLRDPKKEGQALSPNRIRVYRGGYLPSERREIERQLFDGELLAVAATNAMELGVDVGHIRACLIVGYPGSFSSLWQQSGRAGRGQEASLTIFIASNDPEDQYLIRNPEYFLHGAVEAATIDPQNPYILAQHMGCAAFELPLREEEGTGFGSMSSGVTRLLEEEQILKRIDRRLYWARPESPASHGGLRHFQGQTFTITLSGPEATVIGTMDESQAPLLAHPGAVYLHEGDTYLVETMDAATHLIRVKRIDLDYYTRAMVSAHLQANTTHGEKSFSTGSAKIADVDVSWRVAGFRKIKFYSWDALGVEPLDLPPQRLSSVALILRFHAEAVAAGPGREADLLRGLQGLQNSMGSALPLLALCDRNDLGSWIQPSQDGRPELYLYDRYPGGMGYCEQGFERLEELLDLVRQMIVSCPCLNGCPSCVGVAESGLGAMTIATAPDKAVSLQLLGSLPAAAIHSPLSPRVH